MKLTWHRVDQMLSYHLDFWVVDLVCVPALGAAKAVGLDIVRKPSDEDVLSSSTYFSSLISATVMLADCDGPE